MTSFCMILLKIVIINNIFVFNSNITPVYTDHTSATYQWQSTAHYQFKVKSQNQVGQSVNASILKVQPSLRRPIQLEQLKKITKVYHNQSYTISWQQPGDLESLINFTVFWCISKMESQSQCKVTPLSLQITEV